MFDIERSLTDLFAFSIIGIEMSIPEIVPLLRISLAILIVVEPHPQPISSTFSFEDKFSFLMASSPRGDNIMSIESCLVTQISPPFPDQNAF